MKRKWEDTTKRPASEATLNTKGSFAVFKEATERIVRVKPGSVSRAPVDEEKP
jgi:hypothetical protein